MSETDEIWSNQAKEVNRYYILRYDTEVQQYDHNVKE